MARSQLLLIVALALAAVLPSAASAKSVQDATVVAVIDSGMDPHHWDYSAVKMPGDLPLDRPASEWLKGFPSGATRLGLTLDDKNAKATLASLRAKDTKTIDAVKPEQLYWLPGTKVIGAMTFNPTGKIFGAPTEHGMGTTSSAVGNLHGTCPECLLVFLQYGDAASAEKAIDWAMKQPWIDVISNSYGFSLASRDRLYSKSNVKLQKEASERGQTIFFSAGNGQENAFLVPNLTTYSSQEGPDWIVTVAAVTPGPDNYYGAPLPVEPAFAPLTGTGKPADIAGIGSSYPTAYGATTTGGTGTTGFSGTSNATPQIAGTYAHALSSARAALAGPSRKQDKGVIASGAPVQCGAARAGCELGDGVLTAGELRGRLFLGAKQSDSGPAPAGFGSTPKTDEAALASIGHGYYFGREGKDRNAWLNEFDARLFGPLIGTQPAAQRPEGERDWMVVDSYCRQQNWGAWSGGYYVEGRDQLPGDDQSWPVRSARERTCPGGPTPVN